MHSPGSSRRSSPLPPRFPCWRSSWFLTRLLLLPTLLLQFRFYSHHERRLVHIHVASASFLTTPFVLHPAVHFQKRRTFPTFPAREEFPTTIRSTTSSYSRMFDLKVMLEREEATAAKQSTSPTTKQAVFGRRRRGSFVNNTDGCYSKNCTSTRENNLNQKQQSLSLFNQQLQSLVRNQNDAQGAQQLLYQALLNNTATTTTSVQNNINHKIKSPFVNEKSFNICIMGHARQRHDANAPIRAEALLQKLESFTERTAHPSTFTYNAVMEAWSKNRNISLEQAQYSVERLFHEIKHHTTLSPNTYSYNLVMEVQCAAAVSASKSNNSSSSLNEALALLEEMKETEGRIKPDRRTISILLKACARLGRAQDAQEILNYALDCFHKGGKHEMKPTNVWFNNVIHAWSNSLLPEAGERADVLLQEMHTLYFESGQDYGEAIRPDLYSYNLAMNAHASHGNITRVEELLVELQHLCAQTRNPDLEPDTITYSTLIKAYANAAADHSNAEHASAILKHMQQLSSVSKKVKPNLVTYNTVIKIWSQLATLKSLERASGVLQEMKRHGVQPDSTSYAELLLGWSSTSGLRQAGCRAQEYLEKIESLPASKKCGVKMIVLYNAVISAWAKSGDAKATPNRVEALLTKMEQQYLDNKDKKSCPDTTTFTSVVNAYSKSRVTDAQERIDALVERMVRLRKAGAKHIRSDRAFYNAVLNALGKSCQEGVAQRAEELVAKMISSKDPKCRPDITTYASLISCYTKSGEPPNRAEELLEFVEKSYLVDKNELLKPNPVFYSTVLQAWAKSATSEGADKAERLLRRNLDLWKASNEDYARPHAIVFNAVMDAIARSGDACCGRRAEALLVEMEDLYKTGNNDCMKPSRRSFSAVILAYRQDGDANKAEELLNRMEQLTEEGVYNVRPCVVDYNCVIGALADSNDMESADRAQALLDRSLELYRKQGNWAARPDEITYSGVIKAWLKRNDEKGREMAHILLQDFLDFVKETKPPAGATDTVWKVINTYRKGGDEVNDSTVDRVLHDMESEFEDIDWSTV